MQYTQKDWTVTIEAESGKKFIPQIKDLPEEIIQKLTLYGLTKKLRDSAFAHNDEDQKLQKMKETFSQLCDGYWYAPRPNRKED